MEGIPFIVFCLFGILIVFTVLIASAIRIIPEHRRMAVYRLGRFIGERGPGLVFLIPIVDRGISVDPNEFGEQPYRNLPGTTGETIIPEDGDDETLESTINRVWQRFSHDNRSGFVTFVKKYISFMKPDFDLGIVNVRLRGLTRMIMGILLTVVWVLILIGGAFLYDCISPFTKAVSPEEDAITLDALMSILLTVFPGVVAVFTSIHLLWGLVEFLLNRSWHQLSSPIRLLLIMLIGIPQAAALFAGILYLASQFI